MPHIPKLRVASSNLVARSNKIMHLGPKSGVLFVRPPKRFTVALEKFYEDIRSLTKDPQLVTSPVSKSSGNSKQSKMTTKAVLI